MSAKGIAHEIVANYREVAAAIGRSPTKVEYAAHELARFSVQQILSVFNSWPELLRAAGNTPPPQEDDWESKGPRVLIWDIETAPIVAHVWGLWDQTVGLNQIKSDWHLLSWAAKWLDEKDVMYMDQRNASSIENDKDILVGLWDLLNEADIVITQNGKAFDQKKTNARFILNGLPPPSPYQHIDTKQLAKKHFAFTSNKLEYMSEKLCTKYKKLKKRKFEGFELWRECIAGNIDAWEEMKRYNVRDVLALEELYKKISPWGTNVSFNPYRSECKYRCNCGSENLVKKGWHFNKSGRFQKYQCLDCRAWHIANGKANNRLTEKKKLSLKGP